MRLKYSLLIGLAVAPWHCLSQTRDGASMEFLDVPQVTRLAGSGGMHVAGGEACPAMVFHNPACVVDTASGIVGLTVSPVTEGIVYASTAYSYEIRGVGTLTAGLIYASYGEFDRTDAEGTDIGTFKAHESAVYLSFSRRMAPWLNLGATVKPSFGRMADNTSFALSMDLGANLTFAENRLQIGAVVRNAGAVVKKYTPDDTRRTLPTDVKMTLAYKAEHAPFRFLLTLKDLTDWDLSVSGTKINVGDNILRHTLVGLEFTPMKAFYFSVGYDQRKRRELTDSEAGGMAGISWGTGLSIAKISIQYAHNRYHEAGSLNSITISTNWRRWVK
ncbi:MAG: type IX secretion system protein PorQ [Marinilabiliaceae bacterium]